MPRSVFLAWGPSDRGYATALQRLEADIHHDCGRPWSESMDPANADRYTVDVLGVCAACYALAAKTDSPQPGPMYRVRLRD